MAVGGRSALPSHEASELLRGTVVPDRVRLAPGSVLDAQQVRAYVRTAREALLRDRLPRIPVRPSRTEGQARERERRGHRRGAAADPRGEACRGHGREPRSPLAPVGPVARAPTIVVVWNVA